MIGWEDAASAITLFSCRLSGAPKKKTIAVNAPAISSFNYYTFRVHRFMQSVGFNVGYIDLTRQQQKTATVMGTKKYSVSFWAQIKML